MRCSLRQKVLEDVISGRLDTLRPGDKYYLGTLNMGMNDGELTNVFSRVLTIDSFCSQRGLFSSNYEPFKHLG